MEPVVSLGIRERTSEPVLSAAVVSRASAVIYERYMERYKVMNGWTLCEWQDSRENVERSWQPSPGLPFLQHIEVLTQARERTQGHFN